MSVMPINYLATKTVRLVLMSRQNNSCHIVKLLNTRRYYRNTSVHRVYCV